MKKITLLFIVCVLTSLAMSAQDGVAVGDVQNSGCLYKTSEVSTPTIVLTKEGSILSVQLLNYESYDATTDFNVTSSISDDEPCSVTINITPVIPDGAQIEREWVCLFNVSFTVRDLEPNKFYLDCWWFKGQVELIEGEPLVLEYKVENVTIDGISFKLLKVMHKAMLVKWATTEEELHIPSEVNYEGEAYTVMGISADAFWNANQATKVTIPKTVRSMDFDYDNAIYANPFRECRSLEWIEVEDGCPLFSSVDGVLFAEDKTMLLGYPNASPREIYTVPEGVTYIRSGAFHHNMYLRKLVIPEEVTYLGWHLFSDTESLEELYIRGILDPECMSDLFYGMDTKVTIYVQPSEVERYKAIYKGPVYPLPEQIVDDMAYYYYYQGKKIPLTLNENKVVVSIPKEYDEIDKRIRANVQVLLKINAETFDIIVISRPNFEALTSLDFWGEDAKSVILTSSYYTETNEEVFATPHLNVRLKNEQDIDLLNSYAEEYRLRIAGKSAFMPWYILAVTPESEKSPLEIANELFESGNFAASVPDLASDILPQVAYHPMIEDDKVWKARGANSGNPAQIVYYYYFDGDTIIDGKTCKQMMCQQYVSPDYPYYDFYAQPNYLSKVGAWYEEDKQVYLYDTTNEQFKLMYDFSLADNGTFQMDGQTYVVGPKQTGGLEGFKGVYRDVMTDESLRCTTWLEGVGGINGPFANAFDPTLTDLGEFLMSCTVGDEVIYLNDEYEDGATPEAAGARNRFDFTHTIKTKPKAPRRSEDERSVYGEYDKLQLGINLNLLADDYVVRITDDSGNVIYEKAVNASTIVGLNIDISGYAKGHYTVTVENSQESFTGEFDTLPTGIEETTKTSEVTSPHIYNLQGQRISTLQKGLNIVNGRKVVIK